MPEPIVLPLALHLALASGDPEPGLDWLSRHYYADLLQQAAQHLLVRVHALFDFTRLEQACADFHHAAGTRGAPPEHAVPRRLRAVVVGLLYSLSLREQEAELRYNLLARWFCGYGLFERTPDHTSLERFEQYLLREHPRLIFDEVLHQLDASGLGEREQLQVGDTFALRANAAHEPLFVLLRHVVRRGLEALKHFDPAAHARLAAALDQAALFGAPGERREDRLSVAERAARLERLVRAAEAHGARMHTYLAETHDLTARARESLTTWQALYAKVCHDALVLTYAPGDASVLLTVRERGPQDKPKDKRKGQGDFALVSATDPEATCRNHGERKDDGYNVQIAATAQVIRFIEARPGAEPDPSSVPAIITDQRTHHALTPPRVAYDQAAGTGQSYADVAAASDGQTQLVARPRATIKRPTGPAEARGPARFSPYDFTLSADSQTLTCPQQQRSTDRFRESHAKAYIFRFTPRQCADCPLGARCRGDRVAPQRERQVYISDHRARVQAARAYLDTVQGQADLKQRSRIERQIAVLVRYQGARTARRRGRAAADYQVKSSAAACNLKYWVRSTTPRPLRRGRASTAAGACP